MKWMDVFKKTRVSKRKRANAFPPTSNYQHINRSLSSFQCWQGKIGVINNSGASPFIARFPVRRYRRPRKLSPALWRSLGKMQTLGNDYLPKSILICPHSHPDDFTKKNWGGNELACSFSLQNIESANSIPWNSRPWQNLTKATLVMKIMHSSPYFKLVEYHSEPLLDER